MEFTGMITATGLVGFRHRHRASREKQTKLSEKHLKGMIDTLNGLICEDGLLGRSEREDMVRAVAVIGAVKARMA